MDAFLALRPELCSVMVEIQNPVTCEVSNRSIG